MNIKMNKAISEIKNLKNMFISASAGDESLSIGCCYYLNKEKIILLKIFILVTKKKILILKNLKKNSVKIIKNPKQIIERLVDGEILGIFNDRMQNLVQEPWEIEAF